MIVASCVNNTCINAFFLSPIQSIGFSQAFWKMASLKLSQTVGGKAKASLTKCPTLFTWLVCFWLSDTGRNADWCELVCGLCYWSVTGTGGEGREGNRVWNSVAWCTTIPIMHNPPISTEPFGCWLRPTPVMLQYISHSPAEGTPQTLLWVVILGATLWGGESVLPYLSLKPRFLWGCWGIAVFCWDGNMPICCCVSSFSQSG